ncbi:hypothetical protein ACFYRG_35935 [Streptomyces mirabilis]|uniref:Rv1733c family protein n=1 Tax=Streptomyces mirabilis TaxID=68239 RepID=UPI00369CB24F
MSARKSMWRWRSNPLRRHEDIVEAWIILAVWIIAVVGGATAGLMTARAAGELFAQQQTQRHPVYAVLRSDTLGEGAWPTRGQVRAPVRWTAPDGTSRTERTLVDGGLKAGARVVVWQDDWGRLTTQPTGRTEAAVEADLFGSAAALAVAAPALGAGALARARLDRRRIARWDREWDLVGRR